MPPHVVILQVFKAFVGEQFPWDEGLDDSEELLDILGVLEVKVLDLVQEQCP